jgi:transcriptional regulator with XRE-family HTH domain
MPDVISFDTMVKRKKNTKATPDLATQIREAFAKSGMNRLELSRRSGVAYSAVHRFIAGDRDATLATATRWCEVLGLELRPVRRTRKGGK